MTAWLRSLSVLVISGVLLAGCAGGVQVVRSDPRARVDPAPIALAGLTLPSASRHADAPVVLRSFHAALDEALPGFHFVDAGDARYRLHVVDLDVERHDGDTRATLRLALSEQSGAVLDEVVVTALGHDPEHAGLEAARHFGRYLTLRDSALE